MTGKVLGASPDRDTRVLLYTRVHARRIARNLFSQNPPIQFARERSALSERLFITRITISAAARAEKFFNQQHIREIKHSVCYIRLRKITRAPVHLRFSSLSRESRHSIAAKLTSRNCRRIRAPWVWHKDIKHPYPNRVGERRLSYVSRLVGMEGRRKARGGEGVGGLRVGEGARGCWRAGERDRKESGVTYRRNKCARVMLMANMVEEI